ncbi:PVC-type heme-binding CxxCH protein [Pollutibacter soli]|uniref:PVC-type heme-binding CxxCH protein n=1 Tax=Pollutibacter soli TaxID=3034157 RepID=UPI003013938A
MKKSFSVSLPGMRLAFVFLSALIISSCGNNANDNIASASDSLTEEQKHLPENALKGLALYDGLEITPFATEPMLVNPTNIDVDDKGRVWVLEAYNYRPAINGNPTHTEGDRIVILQDTNGDGKADSSMVFYQGPEINSPLGISVLGNRVIVSQSPYVWVFYDDNNDLKADRKEIMFQGIGGEQHDHGMHSFVFGPDGKLYFNFGNEGKTLLDKNGKPVLDQDGEPIAPPKYRQGMVFRADPDGSNVECLGKNFRNNFEVTVDSYGTLWQSDNDDDGNKGVRINYVMPYGNYGYQDEMTGAHWSARRTNWEDSIPQRHWHLNDPGTIPNLLQTGAGSPTGIITYEGKLLPAAFQNQLIHCDAGPNVVRSYPVEKDGAGYKAKIVNLVKGENDQWFRPADVCVAPDGSLFIADWYDPGVGGHAAGDQQRGRIYRVAPKGTAYTVPAQDYNTIPGLITALQNPNLETRFFAFINLKAKGADAVAELEKLWKSSAEPRMRARAFWVLVKIKGGTGYIDQALADPNPDIRIMGIRAAAEEKTNLIPVLEKMVKDSDVQVRRECAIALYHVKSPQSAALWTTLAQQYDGKDRWYLEALGVGADRQWDEFFKAYEKAVGDVLKTPAGRDIVWRARTDVAIPYLAQLAADRTVPLQQRLRYFRAFDFNPGKAKSALLLQMIANNEANDPEVNKLVLNHLDAKTVKNSPVAMKALKQVVQSVSGTPEYIDLVQKYELKEENPKLLELAISDYTTPVGRDAARIYLQQGNVNEVWKVINGKDTVQSNHLLKSIGRVGSAPSLAILQKVITTSSYPIDTRKVAALGLGRSGAGEDAVIAMLKSKKVPDELIPSLVESVSKSWRRAIRTEAASFLPASAQKEKAKVPTLAELNALTANVAHGKEVYKTACAACHQVNNEGAGFGPALSEIGSKLPKEGLLDAIVNPSKGISFGYEGWEIKTKEGSTIPGIIASKTESDITLKFPGGTTQLIKNSDIASRKQMETSMMTEGLYESMSTQDLADLLGYLESLKKK